MKNRLFAVLTALILLLALSACHRTEDVVVTTTEPVVTTAGEETTAEEETTEKTDADKSVSTTVVKNQVVLSGTWDDRFSQRATMEVRGGKGQTYSIHVHWSSTAYEADDWTMTGTFNDSTGELTYKDCTRKTITLSDSGAETEEVHYTGGTGKFLYSNGELSWHADNDPDVNDCVFAR